MLLNKYDHKFSKNTYSVVKWMQPWWLRKSVIKRRDVCDEGFFIRLIGINICNIP
jgi:hypothetical protein